MTNAWICFWFFVVIFIIHFSFLVSFVQQLPEHSQISIIYFTINNIDNDENDSFCQTQSEYVSLNLESWHFVFLLNPFEFRLFHRFSFMSLQYPVLQ